MKNIREREELLSWRKLRARKNFKYWWLNCYRMKSNKALKALYMLVPSQQPCQLSVYRLYLVLFFNLSKNCRGYLSAHKTNSICSSCCIYVILAAVYIVSLICMLYIKIFACVWVSATNPCNSLLRIAMLYWLQTPLIYPKVGFT